MTSLTQNPVENWAALSGWVAVAGHDPLPMLPRHAGRDEVTAYLRWLADSPYCYHLDDDAEDCGFAPAAGRVLAWNAQVLTEIAEQGEILWADMWAIYYPNTEDAN